MVGEFTQRLDPARGEDVAEAIARLGVKFEIQFRREERTDGALSPREFPGDLGPAVRQPDTVVLLVVDERVRRQAIEHLGGRRRRHVQPGADLARADSVRSVRQEPVDDS